MLDKFQKEKVKQELKLKFQVQTNLIIFISALILAIVVGLAMAFLK